MYFPLLNTGLEHRWWSVWLDPKPNIKLIVLFWTLTFTSKCQTWIYRQQHISRHSSHRHTHTGLTLVVTQSGMTQVTGVVVVQVERCVNQHAYLASDQNTPKSETIHHQKYPSSDLAFSGSLNHLWRTMCFWVDRANRNKTLGSMRFIKQMFLRSLPDASSPSFIGRRLSQRTPRGSFALGRNSEGAEFYRILQGVPKCVCLKSSSKFQV